MSEYLFQDRYKSIVTQDQHYIEDLVRYVHLNRVRVGICSYFEVTSPAVSNMVGDGEVLMQTMKIDY